VRDSGMNMPPFTERCSEKYLKKLAGRTDMDHALKRLDKLTQEEVRMAIAQNLTVTHIVDDRVRVVADRVLDVDDRVASVNDGVQVVDARVASVDNSVQIVNARAASINDKVEAINDKVTVAIDGM
jgi:regulator of protease activity HflC (stomatin/prohibitin superfamily)